MGEILSKKVINLSGSLISAEDTKNVTYSKGYWVLDILIIKRVV